MRTIRLFALMIALAFFLPACGASSPTAATDDAIPEMATFDLDEGDGEEECVEEDGEITCGLGGFLGSGG